MDAPSTSRCELDKASYPSTHSPDAVRTNRLLPMTISVPGASNYTTLSDDFRPQPPEDLSTIREFIWVTSQTFPF